MNEKLIEEARATMRRQEWAPAGLLIRLADALEAAENALTPTDDEREALKQIVIHVSANTPGDLTSPFRRDLIVSKILAAGFRRTEVPEPSAECPQCHRADGQHKLGCGERFGAEPQAEPSPIPFYDEKMRELAEVRAQRQPSDAQAALIDAAESMTPDEIHQHPMAALDKLRALAREMRVTGGIQSKPSEEQREAAMDAAWGFRAETRPIQEKRNAQHWFDAGWRAALRAASTVTTPQGEPSDAQVNRDYLAQVIHKAVYSRIPLDDLTDEARTDTYKRADAVVAALRAAGEVLR